MNNSNLLLFSIFLFYLQLPITKDMMVLHFKKHNRYLTRDRVTILY